MYYYKGSVHVERDDQCITCKNFTDGVACPLLQALAMGLVTMDGTLYVTNCGFYQEFVRKLKLVPDQSASKDEKDSGQKKEKSKKGSIRKINKKDE